MRRRRVDRHARDDHECDAFERLKVVEWMAVYHKKVGLRSGRERAYPTGQAHFGRGHGGGWGDDVAHGHTSLMEQPKLGR